MEAVGQLAGGIAHDFNNLLSVILGYAQLAVRELGPEHKTIRRLDAVCKAADRAAALTRQILTFSRQQNAETRVCDVNHIVEDMERMLRRLIGEDVRLAVALDQDVGRVRADPGQLEQVIMNLAVNARDAMPRGGRLVLETSNVELDEAYAQSHAGVSPGAYVVLAISDTGEGMEPAILARIFEPFYTTKGPGKGTGLGLAVVFGIVKQSGGFLSVYSEPGRGSTFRVFRPRVFEEEMPVSSREGIAPVGGSETVLVVEDEDALRGIVVETLREAGYTVLEAPDPRLAATLAAKETQAIHLLLSDVVLPGQSGPETAIQLRKARPAMRVLLMSGYTDRLLDRDPGTEAPTPFLSKPFTIDALLRKVREVLDERNPEKQDAAGK
jgi:CheY-like chemotaxis protein